MDLKIILIVLACFFLQASQLSLTKHDGNYDTCFYVSVGNILKDNRFNYTITQAWDAAQAEQLKSGALNTSDFIHVQGWEAYSKPNRFFSEAGRKGHSVLRILKPIKDVTQVSDAPQFGFATNADLEFAFGSPSQAKLYKVPSGKAVLAVRFQAAVAGSPYLGKWSVLVDLIEDDEIARAMKIHSARLRKLVAATRLTPRNVTSSLNIIPPFIENSLFWTFSSSPAQGTTAPVAYQGFLVVIRAGQEFLAGPIANGQPNIVQVKDVVSPRTECTE